MLILAREKEQSVMIGDRIEVKVTKIGKEKVRLGIIAPPEIPVHRREVWDDIRTNGKRSKHA